MLRTIRVELLVRDPIPVSENSTVNKIRDGDSEVRAKAVKKNLVKSKNLVKFIKSSF